MECIIQGGERKGRGAKGELTEVVELLLEVLELHVKAKERIAIEFESEGFFGLEYGERIVRKRRKEGEEGEKEGDEPILSVQEQKDRSGRVQMVLTPY